MKTNQILKSLYENNALYESVYCSIVACNDYIKELKENLKYCDIDIKNGDNVELCESQKISYKETLKEYQEKRRLLKKALRQIFNDNASEYND